MNFLLVPLCGLANRCRALANVADGDLPGHDRSIRAEQALANEARLDQAWIFDD